ncbi:transmembrane protein 69 [Eurytemora carolleeae]|uniref:transmembrane protein 69 n=1 Tax=Eurytemora carolleeae TaxID=1294199 RepID=UPI000C77EA15|nr:transmembrane protein 69 [Eurytemora carolleeae]|eukprot:XP_023321295.1 transmembrane protein 69-like [Eurytemora affinis]
MSLLVSILPASWAQYSWSVTLSLLAWCSLLLPEAGLGCALCAGSLALTAYLDLIQPGYPSWFRALRFILSTGAVLSLLATLFCIFTLGPKKQASDYLS